MPQTKYTDADLPRFERKPLSVSIERPSRSETTTGDRSLNGLSRAAELLAKAKGSLANADSLWSMVQGAGDNSEAIDKEIARLKGESSYTEPIANALDVASIPAMFVPGLNVPASAWTAARSGQRLVEGGTTRLKEHPVESALDVAGVAIPAARGLKGLKAAMQPGPEVVGKAAKWLESGAARGGVKGHLPEGIRVEDMGNVPEVVDLGNTPASVARGMGGRVSPKALLEEVNPQHGPFAQPPSSRPIPRALGGRPERLALPEPSSIQLPESSFANAKRLPPSRVADEAGLKGLRQQLDYKPYNPANTSKRVVPKKGMGRQSTVKNPEDMAFDRESDVIDLPGFEVVNDVGGMNASGESAASLEALSRAAGMASRGEKFVVFDRAGNMRPLIGPDAVDYVARPGETYGVLGKNGFRTLTDLGGRVRK